MVSRFRSCMTEAIKDLTVFPQLIVVIPDDDLIWYLNFPSRFGISKSLGRAIDWIMSEYDKLVSSQKDYLPPKAKRSRYPQFIWIEAPEHN